MRRVLFVAALGAALLSPASASAHKGSAAKAGKFLERLIDGADSTRFTTGEVRVSGCKAKRSGRRGHRHVFRCRASVQRVYPNGTSKTCKDRSVTVLRGKRGYRRAKGTYMDRGGSSCGRLIQPQLPPQVTPTPPAGPLPTDPPTPAPEQPPAPEEAPEADVPPGMPPGFPPLPGIDFGQAFGDAEANASQLGYFFQLWYPWYYDTYGYAWLVGKWYFQGPGCNADYYAFYWWNGYYWQYYGELWVLNAYYTEDQVMGYQPC
jgi:hypothetical protein